jgi:hypothetical protein
LNHIAILGSCAGPFREQYFVELDLPPRFTVVISYQKQHVHTAYIRVLFLCDGRIFDLAHIYCLSSGGARETGNVGQSTHMLLILPDTRAIIHYFQNIKMSDVM